MSRKFNMKKFIKDVLNDRYAHLQTTTKSVVEVFLWSSFGAIKEIAGYSHTPACYLSKLVSFNVDRSGILYIYQKMEHNF